MPATAAHPAAPRVTGGIDALLVAAAAASPEKLAVVEASGRSLTWRELDDEVGRVATGLGEAGVVAGYRVALVLGNRLETVVGYLAVLRAQAVAVPLDPGSSPAETARVLEHAGARMVLADPGSLDVVRDVLARRAADVGAYRPRLVTVGADPEAGERGWDELRAGRARRLPALRDPEQLAVLMHTSGTTGAPRAVMLSHRALRANVEQVAQVEPPLVHGDDVVLGVLPLCHAYGLTAVLGAVLRQRAKLVMADSLDPGEVLDLVEDEACSVLPLSPGVLDRWAAVEHLEDRLGPVRLVLSGSAPLDPGVAADFTARTGLDVHDAYGLTEAAPVLAVGAALPGVELRLVDRAGAEVEAGDPGEVRVRGPQLFSGYWPDGAGGPDPDGWWSTGDVALVDDTGGLVWVDRVAETVVVAGFTVYPARVEAVLAATPGVRAAAVVAEPDADGARRLVAHVVAAPGFDAEEVLADVSACARDALAAFERPDRVRLVARLPLTRAGTVARDALRRGAS